MRQSAKAPKGQLEDDVHTFLHPVRFAIIEQLLKGPQYISELAHTMDLDRRLITYHLACLENYGFVSSHRIVSETANSLGKGLHIYEVTPKVEEVKALIRKIAT
jgi:predicted transcriptional regulator